MQNSFHEYSSTHSVINVSQTPVLRVTANKKKKKHNLVFIQIQLQKIKKVESLCYTPETNIIFINYTSI